MGKPREKKRKRERIRERERGEGGKREQGERERMLEREADKDLGCILCDFIEPVSEPFQRQQNSIQSREHPQKGHFCGRGE